MSRTATHNAPTRTSPLDRHGRPLTLDEARKYTPFNNRRNDRYVAMLRARGITVYCETMGDHARAVKKYLVSNYSLAEYLDKIRQGPPPKSRKTVEQIY